MGRLVAVVDDDRDIRDALESALSDEGYDVRVVPNGLKLIGVLKATRPDLILLDVRMSWIDGFELCRAIKKNEDYQGIPVMFISARASREDVAKGLACGAVDFIPKPFALERLLGRIAEVIGGP